MLQFSRWKIAFILLACLASIVAALPNFVSAEHAARLEEKFGLKRVALGLDLRGGAHLLLMVDMDAYMREQMSNVTDEIRGKLRSSKIGYRNIGVNDGKVFFTPRDVVPGTDVEALIKTIDPALEVETASDGQMSAAYGEEWLQARRLQIIEQSVNIIDRRINEDGTREPIIQRQGVDRILLQVPGVEDPEHLKQLLGRTAKLTFHLLDDSVTPEQMAQGIVPAGTRIVLGDQRNTDASGRPQKYAVFARAMLSGDMLVDAHTSFGQNGEPVVAFRFNSAGAQKFGDITTQNVGKLFAVVLDNRVITAPVIRGPIIGGSGVIEGGFDTKSANDLSLLLRAGALPAPLKVIEERSVGPSLGADSIQSGIKASVVGIGLVIGFMILFYGLFGLFANIAMLVNAVMTLALLSLLGATLTLPGIAGIVLTVGMAVDANVLIYERMREEIRNGKSPFSAVESGFKLAFGTIIDSHVTTLVAALLLYCFGSGTIKGFAVTLAIGIACSLFTAVLVTRLMVAIWMKRKRPKTLPI